MLDRWRRLKTLGVLALNRRNREYVMRYNARSHYPLVDDKLKTKQLAIEAGIAVPELYAQCQSVHDVANLDDALAPYQDFVIKPAHGSGGAGVLVIDSRRQTLFAKPDGRGLDLDDLKFHATNILSGVYSLGGVPDKVMIEYRVRIAPIFDHISYHGVPDIRLLIYRGIPTLAMVRLPTRLSDGKANLHQGAVGIGVDITSGTTLGGVWQDRVIEKHPDFSVPLSGIQIPDWSRLLELGARSFDLTNLGYLGVDIVLDRDLGPLILELNARPGLAIQIANRRGLLLRFHTIDGLTEIPRIAAERVSLAQSLCESVT